MKRAGSIVSRYYAAGEFDDRAAPRSAHVIVVGNEKGGSGKTTLSMHLVVFLLARGHRIATIDLDMRQRSFSRYVHNRAQWMRRTGERLRLPNHYEFAASQADSRAEMRAEDYGALAEAIGQIEREHDFVVIDTPGADHHLMRLAHSLADTLVTPLNDSFVDFDVLGRTDPLTGELKEIAHYAAMVRDARKRRRTIDGQDLDWLVVRNRLAPLDTRNRRALDRALDELALQLGFRSAPGVSERVIFREFFPKGLTALDDLDEPGPGGPTQSHLAARQEIRALIRALRLEGASEPAPVLPTVHAAGEWPDVFAD